MEILHKSPIQHDVFRVTTLKDEIFILPWGEKLIVYDRNNIAEEKDVIPLPGMLPVDIATCNVSNCVYVLMLDQNTESHCLSVLRITKEEEHQFSMSPWIGDLRMSSSILSVSADGDLIVVSNQGSNPAVVSMYDANGSLKHRILLSTGIYKFRMCGNVLKKSNGNLVLMSLNDQRKTRLTEIDMSGSIVRQYQSALGECSAVNFADIYGRVVMSGRPNGIELLDSELNLLNATEAQLNGGQFASPHILHYDSEKNEVVGISKQKFTKNVLTIFRFI